MSSRARPSWSARVGLSVGLLAGALTLAAVFAVAANVALSGPSWSAVSVVESLYVDGDVDLFDQMGALAPAWGGARPASLEPEEAARTAGTSPARTSNTSQARPNAVVASLATPICAIGRMLVPAGGRERATVRRACGGVLSLACLFALVLGTAHVARALIREGHGPLCALIATATAALATPLVGELLRAPDLAQALAFLAAAALMAWRTCPRVPDGPRVVLAVALFCVQPVAAGWLLLVVWDLARPAAAPDPERPAESPFAVLVALALLVAAQLGLAWLRHESPLPALPPERTDISRSVEMFRCLRHPAVALGGLGLILRTLRGGRAPSLLTPIVVAALLGASLGDPAGPGGAVHPVALVPALAAGLAELGARAAGRGCALAAVLLAALCCTGGVAVELAARLGVPVTAAPAAVAWAWHERALIPSLALAPGTDFLAPASVVVELGGVWWGSLPLAAGAAVLALLIRRLRPSLVLAALGLCGAAFVAALHGVMLAGRPLHVPTFAGPRAVLDGASPAHSWYPPQGTLGTLVDIAFTTEPSPSLGAGDLLMSVLVRDDAGREHVFPVRAERGFRVERRFRCALPWRVPVAEVRVSRQHPVARILVRGVWLGDAVRSVATGEGRPSS